MRRLSLILAALALAGCAAPSNWVKPGSTADDLTRQQAKCRMAARAVPVAPDGTDPMGFGEAAAAQGQYQDCMVSDGWKALN